MAESVVKPTKTVRKTTRRTAKTAAEKPETAIEVAASAASLFDKLLNDIFNTKNEFEELQRDIAAAKGLWKKEQEEHKRQIAERDTQEEIERQREKERYEYETQLIRKKAENDFEEKLNKWEKELAEKKEEIAGDKKELEALRKRVEEFDGEKEEAVETAKDVLEKELNEKFESERQMREQEIKAEKEILNLKLESLTAANNKQAAEIANLQKALNAATAQVKDIAVKVIEAGGTKAAQSAAATLE